MAGSLNKVMIIGRIGQDPKLSYLPSGQPVSNFSVATDEGYRDKNSGEKVERTEWHRIAVFGKSAEFCANYLSKGRLVYIEGTLRTRKWQKEGQDHYTTEVIVDFKGTVQGLDSRPSGDRQQYGQQGPQQGGQQDYNRNQGGGYGGNQGGGQGGYGGNQGGGRRDDEEDLGPAFPSEASGMDDVPF